MLFVELSLYTARKLNALYTEFIKSCYWVEESCNVEMEIENIIVTSNLFEMCEDLSN